MAGYDGGGVHIFKIQRSKLILGLTGILTVLLAGCTTTASPHPASSQSVRSTSKVQSTPATHHQAIKITVNGVRLAAHLNNSSAARAFANKLPINLKFRNFMDMPEKVADLHHSLPTTGMPTGHAGTAGSIGYWSPDKRIVFYWGTEDYYEGIHIIGTFDHHDYKKVVRKMAKNTTVKIEKVNTNENQTKTLANHQHSAIPRHGG